MSCYSKTIAVVHPRFIWRMPTQRQVAANSQTKPTVSGCESACKLLPSTSAFAIYYCYSVWKLMLILLSKEGGRLSRYRHSCKGVLKAVSQWLRDWTYA